MNAEYGVLVRYADDAIVMCDTREQAEAALTRLTVLLAELGLEPKAARPGSCTWWRTVRGLISWVFTTVWCAGGHPGRRI